MAERARRVTAERSWDNEFAGYVRLLERLLQRPVGKAAAAG
jgi:hypothetical protein